MGSADTTTTWLTGTPAVLAISATTGSIRDCGRFSGPGDTDAPPAPGEGRSLAGANDEISRLGAEAAEQPTTTKTAASIARRVRMVGRSYPTGQLPTARSSGSRSASRMA